MRAIIEAEGLDVDVDDAVWLCWSAVQGLVVLEPKIVRINEHRGGSDVTTDDLVRRFTRTIVAGVRASARR